MDPLFGVGMVDFAGSGVVHVTGGFTALIASKILGPRKGRFNEEDGSGMARRVEGNSSSLQALGVLILWFGWYGFNCGSILQVSSVELAQIASLSGATTTLGASAGAVTSLAVSAFLARRQTGETSYDLPDALNGCLAGLVSITAGCGLLEPWAAALIGGIGGCVYLISGALLVRFRIDDAVEAIPVHLGPGIWGVFSVGLFASPRRLIQIYGHANHPGWFYSFNHGGSDATLLGVNMIGLLFIIAWVLVTMFPFFMILSYLGWFRTDSLEEIIGLDPGTLQVADTVTRQHLAILRKQIKKREGITEEDEAQSLVHTPVEERYSESHL
jgi:Amt family ammonium transporter